MSEIRFELSRTEALVIDDRDGNDRFDLGTDAIRFEICRESGDQLSCHVVAEGDALQRILGFRLSDVPQLSVASEHFNAAHDAGRFQSYRTLHLPSDVHPQSSFASPLQSVQNDGSGARCEDIDLQLSLLWGGVGEGNVDLLPDFLRSLYEYFSSGCWAL